MPGRNTARCMRTNPVRMATCLAAVLICGLAGCGGGGSSTAPERDSAADFGIVLDPASANIVLHAGQSASVTIDLVSANGFPNAVMLTSNSPGLATSFQTPTLPSLPKGVTKVTLNIAVPAYARPAPIGFISYISATGGGITRTLNGSSLYTGAGAGALGLTVAGLAIETTTQPYASPFRAAVAGTTADLSGAVPLVGVSVAGPVNVTLASSYSGITAALGKAIFTPTGPKSVVQEDVPMTVHVGSSVPAGSYPLLLTATDSAGTRATFTVNLYVLSLTFVAPPTLSVGSATGSAASIGADVSIVGPPVAGLDVHLSIASPLHDIVLTVSPSDVTLPANGTLTQHVTIQAQVNNQTAPATYPLTLKGAITDIGSLQAPFTLTVQ